MLILRAFSSCFASGYCQHLEITFFWHRGGNFKNITEAGFSLHKSMRVLKELPKEMSPRMWIWW